MNFGPVFCIPGNAATEAAGIYLIELGLPVFFAYPDNCPHLLLPIPSFKKENDMLIKCLTSLNNSAIISGGNLSSSLVQRFRCVDFLKDPYYLADNAAISARCTVKIIQQEQGNNFHSNRVIILGFGRIAKCLCSFLRESQCELYVAARKESDLALIHSLGMHPISFSDVPYTACSADLLINTIPEIVIPDFEPPEKCLAIELASKPGIKGNHVLSALGLPSKMAPEESGELIAKTFIRLSL